jgi:Rieske Fe-S protein
LNRAPASDASATAFALGVFIIVIGLFVRPLVVIPIGALLALTSGLAWMHFAKNSGRANPEGDLLTATPAGEQPTGGRTLSRSTLLLGAAVGLLVAVPVASLAIVPVFQTRRKRAVDLGPIAHYPEGEYTVVTFLLDPSEGVVSKRAAYIRNNGVLHTEPSFTIISNRCTHVGCPTQPNGPIFTAQQQIADTETGVVRIIPTQPAGFGCPCHGSQFDTEGNRIAGPAVRPLDRYEFEIRDSRLYLERLYSVSRVDGSGADARIHAVPWRPPGEPASGIESLLYPVQAGS